MAEYRWMDSGLTNHKAHAFEVCHYQIYWVMSVGDRRPHKVVLGQPNDRAVCGRLRNEEYKDSINDRCLRCLKLAKEEDAD